MSWKEGRGDPRPGRVKRPVYDLVYPRPGEPIDATVLSATYTGIRTHWIPGGEGRKGRTALCRLPAPCPHCGDKWAAQWNAYLAIWRNPERRRAILTLTELGVDTMEDIVKDAKDLRGERLWFARTTAHKSSAVTISHVPGGAILPIPIEHDIWHTIRVIYGDPDTDAVLDRTKGKDGGRP